MTATIEFSVYLDAEDIANIAEQLGVSTEAVLAAAAANKTRLEEAAHYGTFDEIRSIITSG